MPFIPGLELNERYYHEVVAPLLAQFDPALRHSASLIGYGSDVLGYDNATSTDHNWGPRMQVFVDEKDAARICGVDEFLRAHLPAEFLGYPTNFSDKRADGTQKMTPGKPGEINHLIELTTLEEYFKGLAPQNNLDWLGLSEQRLLEATRGKVFHDGLGRLEELREKLRAYPLEVRLVRLAACWNCVAEEEAFVGRRVEFGDRLGAKLIAARLGNVLLKACFTIKSWYMPYSKWFTRAFDELELPEIRTAAENVLCENELKPLEEKVADFYLKVIDLQNRSGEFPRIEAKVGSYYNRPYRVVMAHGIADQLMSAVKDSALREVDLKRIGAKLMVDGLDFTQES